MVAHDGSVASAAIEFGTVIDGGVVSPGGGGGGGETVEITYTLSGGLVMYRLPSKESKVIPDGFEPTDWEIRYDIGGVIKYQNE